MASYPIKQQKDIYLFILALFIKYQVLIIYFDDFTLYLLLFLLINGILQYLVFKILF